VEGGGEKEKEQAEMDEKGRESVCMGNLNVREEERRGTDGESETECRKKEKERESEWEKGKKGRDGKVVVAALRRLLPTIPHLYI